LLNLICFFVLTKFFSEQLVSFQESQNGLAAVLAEFNLLPEADASKNRFVFDYLPAFITFSDCHNSMIRQDFVDLCCSLRLMQI